MKERHSLITAPCLSPLSRQHYLTFCTFSALLLLFVAEPCLANKFETIGGGVSGSLHIKTAHVRLILYAVSGLFLLGAILSLVMPHNNPLLLNYSQWKQSAIFMFVVSVIAITTALLI